MDISNEILKAIKYAMEQQVISCDHTFPSAIKKTNSNGTYVITDESGQERTAKCSIPNAVLKNGQNVWVTIPSGKLNQIYISGVK